MAEVRRTILVGSGPDQLELQPGRYRKESIAGENGRSTTRMGKAHLTVEPTGALHYTNRRGERQDNIDDHVFLRHWRSGVNKLYAGPTQS